MENISISPKKPCQLTKFDWVLPEENLVLFCQHFGVRPLLGISEKKTPKRTWLCVGISPVW